MSATATLKPSARKLTWRAGRDRVSHASEPRATRTLCNEHVLDERRGTAGIRGDPRG